MKLGKNSSLDILGKAKSKLIQTLKGISPEWNTSDDQEIELFLGLKDKNKYVFSNSVLNTLHTIAIKDEFDCSILKDRKTANGIIIIDPTELYIFQEINGKLKVMNFTVSIKDNYSDIKIFTFNLNENERIIEENIETEVWKKFLRCVVYLDFLPTQIKYIDPKGKAGTRKDGKVINETDHTIILVTKAWNQEYRTLPGTKYFSRSHWGIRLTGEGRTVPKVTFIKGSFKEIHKSAEKETKR